MASSKGYGRRGAGRLADMSLPEEERGRRKTARTAGRRKRRDGGRRMNRARRAD